jgi:hypothetical protein
MIFPAVFPAHQEMTIIWNAYASLMTIIDTLREIERLPNAT